VFETWQAAARCCCSACNTTQYQRERGWCYTPKHREVDADLRPEQIERLYQRARALRKATHQALATAGVAWAQRPGAAIHQRAIAVALQVEDE